MEYTVYKRTPVEVVGGRGAGRGKGRMEPFRQMVIDGPAHEWLCIEFDNPAGVEASFKVADKHRNAIGSGSNAYSMVKLRESGWNTKTKKRTNKDDPTIPKGQCWLYWMKIPV